LRIRRRIWWIAGLALLAAATAAYALRHEWQGDPEADVARLLEVLDLKSGSALGEVGAGSGRMTVVAARLLGPSGRVFSTEIEAKKVAEIEQAAAKGGLQNVTAILGGEKETKLPKDCCDGVFLRRVYHHFTDAAPLNASLYEALRPGGRLAVIDFAPKRLYFWLPRPSGVSPDRDGHGMPPGLLLEELARAGFVLDRQVNDWSAGDYCVVVRKPAAAN